MPVRRKRPRLESRYSELHVRALVYGNNRLKIRGVMPTFDDIIYDDERYAAMREAWPVLRRRCFAMCERERERERCPLRPWGWWEFESPEKRDEEVDEAEQLRGMGVLEPVRG